MVTNLTVIILRGGIFHSLPIIQWSPKA